MSSSVFFRFKSQKEPSRVTFDGTGISVFELKREIITQSRLGDGTDFELILSSADGSEIYDDDTTIIPRSTTVIAKRLPAARPGKGGAARYVSGKMPIHAKNSHRSEAMKASAKAAPEPSAAPSMEAQTEEERMAAILKMGSEQWSQQKQEMASATPIFRPGAKGKTTNVPDRPLPPGYVCYRCGEKGHWIQECPTNDDPNFTNQRRLKRTTGIPKSFLKTVEKPTSTSDGSSEAPAGVMINAEGDWVIAQPDKASWEQFQAKANKSAAAQQEVDSGLKEIRDKGLACPIDQRLFVDPTKTPCCQKTYCNECITNALLDDGLQCPNCEKEGVLIDDLQPDSEMATRIREYEEEKVKQSKKEPSAEPPKDVNAAPDASSPNKLADDSAGDTVKDEDDEGKNGSGKTNGVEEESKKRKAESELDNDRKSPGPKAEETKESSTAQNASIFPPELEFMNQPPFANGGAMPAMPNMNMMGMNPMMFAQMMTMQGNMGWGGPNQMNPQQFGNMNGQNQMGVQQPNGMQGVPTGPRAQRNNFGGGRGEDSAYFRQPVNPRRGRGGRNFQRPPDYREV